jgi:hypothetical protein
VFALTAAALASVLAGCVTTQEKNSWKLLVNARTLASQKAVHVTRENPGVRVRSVQLVRDRRGIVTAVAARLRNLTERPLTDLPISVGVLASKHARTYLNRRANLDYYDSHVPAIAAGAATIWVLPVTAKQAKDLRGAPFAVVGRATTPPSTTVQQLPEIGAVAQGGESGSRLRVSVDNHSGLPQFGVQLYAVAVRGGQFVAAARKSIRDLDGGASAIVDVTLPGNSAHGSVQLSAPPTIFH